VSSDPFAPLPLFAFPLFSSVIAGHEQHKGPLLDAILAHRQRHPGIRRSNRDAWHSGSEFLQLRDEHVGWALQNVHTFARRALARFYKDWAGHDLKMGSYWANVLGKGGWNAPHHHFPQHWSGAYYVSVGQVGTDGDLSGHIEFLNPSPWQTTWGSGNFAYGPREGLVMLFPASLLHLVHPHQSDEPRVSIAFNFNVLPKSAGA